MEGWIKTDNLLSIDLRILLNNSDLIDRRSIHKTCLSISYWTSIGVESINDISMVFLHTSSVNYHGGFFNGVHVKEGFSTSFLCNIGYSHVITNSQSWSGNQLFLGTCYRIRLTYSNIIIGLSIKEKEDCCINRHRVFRCSIHPLLS